jgi:hypothetical protein
MSRAVLDHSHVLRYPRCDLYVTAITCPRCHVTCCLHPVRLFARAHTAHEQTQQLRIDSAVDQVLRLMCTELLSSESLGHYEMVCCAFELHILIKDCLHALMQR